MIENYSADTKWSDALTLRERIALLQDAQPERTGTNGSAFAERHIEKWRSQYPFTVESNFSDWLNSNGLNEEQFLRVLSTSSEYFQETLPVEPSWIAELRRAYFDLVGLPPTPEESEAGFLIMMGPLIERGLERLRNGIQSLGEKHSDAPIDPQNLEGMLVQSLLGSLMWRLTRTMVLELNVARLQGLLQGETPAERYGSFLDLLRKPDFAMGILQQYPVLARQLEICVDHWVNFSLEFLTHLCEDQKLVSEQFAQNQELGKLTEIRTGAGDTHRQGRSVIIAKFSSGFQVVYKPHSLSVDVHFAELLQWLNERGDHPPLRAANAIDRGDYGWVQFVENKSCSNLDEVNRFYERQGAFLALLYAMEATELH